MRSNENSEEEKEKEEVPEKKVQYKRIRGGFFIFESTDRNERRFTKVERKITEVVHCYVKFKMKRRNNVPKQI